MSGDGIEPGVILQAINDIFSLIETVPEREYLLRVSYMEIYNEVISDLLANSSTHLKIKETSTGEVYVDGLKEEVVSTPENVLELLRQGQEKRQVGETCMNRYSSRSHAIFRMIIESKLCDSGNEGAVQVSHLNLVDLAGSEKAGQMGTTGQTFKEGVHINQSLLSLGTVIKTLSEGKAAFYRNSKLTRILQNSLGGNARTAIICNATPTSVDQTLSTLMFARRAKDICNKPKVNEVMSDQARLRSHKRKIQELEKELKCLKSDRAKEEVEKELERKDKRIQELEQLAKNLKANVLVSSLTPRMIMRKQRRETWGGHIKGFGGCAAPGVVSANFNLSSRLNSHSQLNLQAGASPPLRRTSSIIDQTIDAFNQSNADLTNISTRPKISKCVTFRMPSLATDFSSNAADLESFRESDEFRFDEDELVRNFSPTKDEIIEGLKLQVERLTTELATSVKAQGTEPGAQKLHQIIQEKDSRIKQLEEKLSREILSFSMVEEKIEEFVTDETNCKVRALESRISNLESQLKDSNVTRENLEIEISRLKLRHSELEESKVALEKDFEQTRIFKQLFEQKFEEERRLCSQLRKDLDESRPPVTTTMTPIDQSTQTDEPLEEISNEFVPSSTELLLNFDESRVLDHSKDAATISCLEKSKLDLLATRNETLILKESELESKIGEFEKIVAELQTELEKRELLCQELRQTVSDLEKSKVDLLATRNETFIVKESELESKIGQLEERLLDSNNQLENALDSKNKFEKMVEELQSEIHKRQSICDELRQTISNLENELESKRNSISKESLRAKEQFEIEMTESRNRLSALNSQVENASEAKRQLETRVAELQAENESCLGAMTKLEDELRENEKARDEFRATIEFLEEQTRDLESQLENVTKSRVETQNETEWRKRIDELSLELERQSRAKEQLEKRAEELELGVETLRQSHQDQLRLESDKVANLENEVEILSIGRDQLNEKLREMTSRLNELEMAKERSDHQLSEKSAELRELRLEKERGDENVRELTSRLGELETSEIKLAETLSQLDALTQSKLQSDRELAVTLAQLEELKSSDEERREMSFQLRELRLSNSLSEGKLGETLRELDELRRLNEERETRLLETLSQLEEITESKEMLERELAETLSLLDELRQFKQQSDQELVETSELEELRQFKTKMEEKLATTLSQLEELQQLKHQSDEELRELSSQLEQVRQLKRQSDEELCEVSSQLEQIRQFKIQSEEKLGETIEKCESLKYEIERYEVRVDVLSEEKLRDDQLISQLRDKIQKLNDKEASSATTTPQNETSDKDQLMEELKFQLEEEKLKFAEFWEDTNQQQLADSEEMAKRGEEIRELEDNIESLKQHIRDLTNENVSLNDKLSKLDSKISEKAAASSHLDHDDESRVKEVEILSSKLSEERAKRYKAETKLANEIKRCESLKRDRKQYEEKIYHLTNQLRKNQTALDETIRRDREEPGSSATMKGDASKVVCNVESNIGSLQVFEAQRQLYQLHKHCKKIEEENTLLRNKYKELKKRLSLLPPTNDKENISTSSDRSGGDSLAKTTRATTTTTTTTTLKEDDPNSDHFLKAKNQLPLSVGEALEPSPKSIADFIPASFAEPPTTPTKKFTFDFDLSTLPNEMSPKKSADECPTQ